MHIKIHDCSVRVDPLVALRSEQRWKSCSQWRKRCLNLLADDIVGCCASPADNWRYRLNRRSFCYRRTADQKAHKKDAAYDE
jgi:hypothetical protein